MSSILSANEQKPSRAVIRRKQTRTSKLEQQSVQDDKANRRNIINKLKKWNPNRNVLNIVIQTRCALDYLLQVFSNAMRVVRALLRLRTFRRTDEKKIHGYLMVTSRINFRGPLYTAELCLESTPP